jgi:hypothetical protein
MPQSDFSTSYNTGFGATVRYDKKINENLSWTATGGFLTYGVKTNSSISSGSFSIIPINGGLKYFFQGGQSGFYGAADLGLFFLHSSFSTGFGRFSDSATKFGISPGVGYRIPQFDFSFRYNAVPNANYLNIRIAYVLKS